MGRIELGSQNSPNAAAALSLLGKDGRRRALRAQAVNRRGFAVAQLMLVFLITLGWQSYQAVPGYGLAYVDASTPAPPEDVPTPAPVANCTPEADPESLFPLWLNVVFGLILLGLSGMFSGLTLGLLGLDTMALKAVAEAGEEPERSYAQKIMPLREDGNLLLCTLLLGNVAVNVLIPLLLQSVLKGIGAFIGSTVFIVIFGEIVPQATCSKHALLIGSKSVPLVLFFRTILYIFAKPIALILDWALGRDAGQIYNKEELKQLLWQHLHEDKLERTEYEILRRALDLQKTEVEEIMTPEDKSYKLDVNTVLSSEKLLEIWQTGHSRIPITESVPDPEGGLCSSEENYVGVLYTKDLITVRVEDNVTVQQILAFYNRGMPIRFDKHAKLDVVLDIFRKGKSHMGFVTEVQHNGGDPRIDVVGIVTLEDVIEQLMGQEIIDEHDNFVDIGAQRRKRTQRIATLPLGMLKQVRTRLSPEQARQLAHYLSYTIADPLAGLEDEQLFGLVFSAGVREIRLPVNETPRNLDSPTNIWVYKRGKPLECFTLVLSGKLEVITCSEGFKCEYGPNQFLGARVLRDGGTVKCDFDCRVLESPCRVVQITYADLEAARKIGPASSRANTPATEATAIAAAPEDVVLSEKSEGAAVEMRQRKSSVIQNPIVSLNAGGGGDSLSYSPTTPQDTGFGAQGGKAQPMNLTGDGSGPQP